MCVTCGCGRPGEARVEGEHTRQHEHVLADGTRVVHSHGHEHQQGHEHAHVLPDGARMVHSHEHEHAGVHVHGHAHLLAGPPAPRAAQGALQIQDLALPPQRREPPAELIELETSLLEKNLQAAQHNRGWLAGRGIMALNLMSSPGAGKTSLLVRTLTDLRGELPMAVVEGDQETTVDAERIRATGAAAIQINTGAGCHLEADMLQRALHSLAPPAGSVLFIENVGNLVCPALFDLGEHSRVVVLSVTEGEDKPLKYPHMFRSAQLMLLTKIDLLPYVRFDADRAEANARSVNPAIRSLRLSAAGGAGLPQWYDHLRTLRSTYMAGAVA